MPALEGDRGSPADQARTPDALNSELELLLPYEQALDLAAGLWGIEPQFFDIWGNDHVTSVETKQAILRAVGVAVTLSIRSSRRSIHGGGANGRARRRLASC